MQPIYEQIKEQVKAQILSGELAENEMLPSLRQLAKDLKINVLTTTRAYNELENVKKTFSNFTLDNISFSLPKGYIMGLIGSNGAGKTTTIKLILNMLDKENGNIEVLGKHYLKEEREIKQNIDVVFDSNFYVDTWTIKETEQALSIFYNEWSSDRFELMIKRFGLSLSSKINELSRGMQSTVKHKKTARVLVITDSSVFCQMHPQKTFLYSGILDRAHGGLL